MNSIEQRLQRLEDIEAIRQLKHRYCALCDDNYNPPGLAGLFAEDAVWDGGPLGKVQGQAAIQEMFKNAPGMMKFAVHYVMNDIIEVSGDTATAEWLLWQPTVIRQNDQAMWLAAGYKDQYVRTADGWRVKHLQLELRMMSPYEAGFGKMQFAPL